MAILAGSSAGMRAASASEVRRDTSRASSARSGFIRVSGARRSSFTPLARGADSTRASSASTASRSHGSQTAGGCGPPPACGDLPDTLLYGIMISSPSNGESCREPQREREREVEDSEEELTILIVVFI